MKAVGYSSQGENTINAAFYDKRTTCPRTIEFDIGRVQHGGDLVSQISSNYISASSYIIPADYEGTCLISSTQGKTLPQLDSKSVSKKRTVNTDDNFPYATSSPKFGLTSNDFLMADGINPTAAESIIKDYRKAKNEDAPQSSAKYYTNISAADVTAYETLVSDGKISTAETSPLNGVPVIIMDSSTYNYDAAIKAYLRILTNSTYLFDSDEANNSRYSITLYKATVNAGSLTLSTDGATVSYDLVSGSSKGFSMVGTDYDTNHTGQFTLIDLAWKDPSVSSNPENVYHVYVPVLTKKLYSYGFRTTIFTGTNYKSDIYTSDPVNDSETRGFKKEDPKVLVENYGTPVTQYLRWTYPTKTLISDVLAGGNGLDWYYEKKLKITVAYGNTIPAGTRFVLVDRNNLDKEWYYTFDGHETYDGKVLILPFSAFKTNKSNAEPTAYEGANFSEIIKACGMTFSKDETAESEPFVTATSTEEGAFQIGENEYAKPAANGNGDFNLTATGDLYEDYYLTIYSKKAEGTLYHQLQITSDSPLVPSVTGKINSKGENIHSVQLNLSDLFTHTVTVTTIEDEKYGQNDKEMKDSTTDKVSDVNVHVQTIININSDDPVMIQDLKQTLDTFGVAVYHSSHVYMNKQEKEDGTPEKVIGDLEAIDEDTPGISVISLESNSVQAYSEYNDTTKTPVDGQSISSTGISGNTRTNFYEIYETNNENPIDLRPFLTSGATGIAPKVVIDSYFKLNYSHDGIRTQFAEREPSETSTTGTHIGTMVSVCSSLAYSPSETTYSSNTSITQHDTVERLYFRYEMKDTSLSFNAYSEESKTDDYNGNARTRANDQLGINIFDEGTETNSIIQTKGIYDASQLSVASESTTNQIRWTVNLRCKEGGYDNGDLVIAD